MASLPIKKTFSRHYDYLVLLDLHSGRLFGAQGELVMDLAAICLLILAASGIWLFFLRQRTNGP